MLILYFVFLFLQIHQRPYMTTSDYWILNLETATKNCSVSLYHNGELMAVREYLDDKYSHAEKLNVFIDEVMKEAKLSFTQLSAVSVSKGPGSYTGLRIGVSSAKGICYAWDIPLIAVDTLEVIAASYQNKYTYLIPVLDARRMEVYTCIYDTYRKRITPIKAAVVDNSSFGEYISKGTTVIIGDAVEKLKNVLQHPQVIFQEKYPSSIEAGVLSYKQFLRNDFVDVAYFEPYYLKDFIAVKPVSKL
jgi:tRNA threonylcarbamoyladenosine biosynthesis protein TsaB